MQVSHNFLCNISTFEEKIVYLLGAKLTCHCREKNYYTIFLNLINKIRVLEIDNNYLRHKLKKCSLVGQVDKFCTIFPETILIKSAFKFSKSSGYRDGIKIVR